MRRPHGRARAVAPRCDCTHRRQHACRARLSPADRAVSGARTLRRPHPVLVDPRQASRRYRRSRAIRSGRWRRSEGHLSSRARSENERFDAANRSARSTSSWGSTISGRYPTRVADDRALERRAGPTTIRARSFAALELEGVRKCPSRRPRFPRAGAHASTLAKTMLKRARLRRLGPSPSRFPALRRADGTVA